MHRSLAAAKPSRHTSLKVCTLDSFGKFGTDGTQLLGRCFGCEVIDGLGGVSAASQPRHFHLPTSFSLVPCTLHQVGHWQTAALLGAVLTVRWWMTP